MNNVEGVLQFLNQLVVKSPKVRIVNSMRGRSLVAATHINQDEHIFTTTPLVAWPKKQSPPIRLDRTCNHCFASNNLVSECQPCQMDKIFMHNMKTYHKLVKTSGEVQISGDASKFEPMVNKLAYRLCKEIQDGYENTNYILNLLSSPEISSDIQSGLSDQHESLVTELTQHGLQKEAESFLTLEWYCRALGVLHLNAISTPAPASGSALYDDLSFINHSCVPTVGFLFHGMRATVVSLCNLRPGDELFIDYMELAAEKGEWGHEQKQENLRHSYGFDCSATCSCGKLR